MERKIQIQPTKHPYHADTCSRWYNGPCTCGGDKDERAAEAKANKRKPARRKS